MTFIDRLRIWFVNLRYVVPGLLVFVAAALIDHPATALLLLIGTATLAGGVAHALDFDFEQDLSRTLAKRALPFAVALLLYGLIAALLVAYPLRWLLRDQSLSATLAVSTEVVVALLSVWRIWPAPGLLFVWRNAIPRRAAGAADSALSRCVRRAFEITGRNELFFSHGLIVALTVFTLIVAAAAIGALGGALAPLQRIAAVAAYALVLAPLASTILMNRSVGALRADQRRRRREPRATPDPQSAEPSPPLAPASTPAAPGDAESMDARLLRCARAGQTELAVAAVARGADPHSVPPEGDRDQRSVLVLATLGKDMRLLRSLIEKGADLNRTHADLAPLIAATRDSHQGRPDAVMTLLTNGADPRCVDAAGNTPLHYAALSATPIVAALLCDGGAALDAANRDGLTPLGMACAAGNRALVRFLLDRGARAEPERAQPAMLAAAAVADDDPSIVELLLKRKAKVDVHDALGRTALMIAALHGNATIVEALLDAGAQAGVADTRGTTALMEAARAGADEVVELLAARGGAIDAVDAMGRSALVIACQSRQACEATIRLLLGAGASADLATPDGKRAVDFAATAGRWNVVALLDPDCPLPASVAEASGGTAAQADPALHLLDALRFSHWNIVETLAGQARDWPIDDLGRLYLELADHAHAAPRAWLLGHGLRPQLMPDGGSALLTALLARLPEATQAALEWHAAGAVPAGSDAIARVAHALPAAGDRRDVLESLAAALVEQGADTFAVDSDGRTPLTRAIAAGSERLVATLLERGVDPNARDRLGRTPLVEALALPTERAEAHLRLLMRAGANPELAASNGETPLGLALARPETELRRWLNWPNWRLPSRRLCGADLPAAAALGDLDAVDKLLDLGLPIDAVDAQGADALLRAAGCGHAALVARLLERGAVCSHAAPTGATPLSAAVTARRHEVVATLLARGVPADSRLPTGGTPLMIAAALGFPEIIDRLLRAGAQPNVSDERGTSALHAAAQFAFRSSETDVARRSIELLLEHGAAVNAVNAVGQTPLLLLLGGRADAGAVADQKQLIALLPLFLLAHADLDLQDQRGVGPLHACAMHGLLLPARALLAARADPLRRDVLERTPRQVAQLLGFVDLAAELGVREPAPQAVTSTAN